MKVNLYLHTDSFEYNGIDAIDVFNAKLREFTSDLSIMRQDKDRNVIYVSNNFCGINVFENKKIFELTDTLPREERNILFSILSDTSTECDLPLEALKSKCEYNELEEECHSIIVFNGKDKKPSDSTYISFDNYEIVYSQSSWYTLRRQILGNHPKDADYFIEECKKYFPDILFHDNNKDVIKEYLECIPRKIIYYLSCLNDCFPSFKKESFDNTNNMLKAFAYKYNMDEEASLQGNPAKKKDLSFDFPRKNDKTSKSIHCEPHLKINKYDSNYKKKKSDNEDDFCARIYFHFGDSDVSENHILIGSIGPHV